MLYNEQKETKTASEIVIRNETPADWGKVEQLTRSAFWNLYVPGCSEHYLVHVMRGHEDFIPALDFVLTRDGEIVGNIMYAKARLVDEGGQEKQILTFGPLCIAPQYQREGYGKRLLAHSFAEAARLGYDVIVIFGSPCNYVGRGFQSCQRHNVCMDDGSYPAAMLVKLLRDGALPAGRWVYYDSPVMAVDEQEAERFDARFAPMEKMWQPSQEEFYILSHSTIREALCVE